jgi:hypothetical protein
MATAGILLAGNWWYASHHNRLIDPNLDVRISRRQLVAPLVTTAIFLFSILISFLNANISRISWLLILLASWYANKD